MTDYSRYNPFIKKNCKETNYSNRTYNQKYKNNHDNYRVKNNINPGDVVTIKYINSNEIHTYKIVEQFIEYVPKGSSNPKGDIRKREYRANPTLTIKENEMSSLSELYKSIKNSKENDIITFNEEQIKIINIKRK